MKIAVIGAGIVGASATYHLAKWGHEVTVIDNQERGQATAHAAGIICPWLSKRRNKVWYELAKNSAAFYPELSEELAGGKIESGYKQVGTLALRAREESLISLFDLAIERRKTAPTMGEIKLLNEEEVRERFPLVKPGFGAVFVSGGGRVRGGQIRDALLQGAAQNGITQIFETAKLTAEGTLFAGEKEVPYDRLVLSAGAFLPKLMEPLGYKAQVLAQKGQIITMTFNQKTDDWPVILPPATKSIVPFNDGEIMLGATHEKEAEFDLEKTEAGYREIVTELSTFIHLESALKSDMSVGTRPYTPDFAPFIGQVGQEPIFVANGLGASGLTTGPFVGKLLAESATSEKTSMDIARFNPAPYITKF